MMSTHIELPVKLGGRPQSSSSFDIWIPRCLGAFASTVLMGFCGLISYDNGPAAPVVCGWATGGGHMVLRWK